MGGGLTDRPRAVRAIGSLVDRALWFAAIQTGLQGLCGGRRLHQWLRLEHAELPVEQLGSEFDGATVAHLSDLHLGLLTREAHISRCVDLVNAVRPDFVVVTGDFLTTGARRYAGRVGALLAELSPRVASLACLGNHDYNLWHPSGREDRALAEYLAEHLDRAGVVTLINESRTFRRGDSELRFVGVGEYWSRAYRPAVAFAGARPRGPTIALCHNTDAAYDLAVWGAQAVLSGHTRGKRVSGGPFGQAIFPALYPEFVAGRYDLGGCQLYVNRGVSSSRRVSRASRPEIALLTLRPAAPHGLAGMDLPDATADLAPVGS
jgi:hypothetical protein